MSADELIYKVKLEADANSFKEISKALDDIEKKARNVGKGGSSGGGSDETEKETNALQELRKELKLKQIALAELQKALREGTKTTSELGEEQKALSASIIQLGSQVQEASKGYTEYNSALNLIPNTLKELEDKQRALNAAIENTPINDQTGQLELLKREYKDNQSAIDAFKASLKDTDVALRQTGTTLADLKTEQKALQSAIENTPINDQTGRLNELKSKLAENNVQIKQFTDSIKESTTAQDSSSKKSEQQSTTLQALKERLSLYRTELAEVNEQARQNGGADENLIAKQQELGKAIRETSARIQEADKGYADQQTALSSVPNTLNELIEKQNALSKAIADVPFDDQSGKLEKLKREYKDNQSAIDAFKASLKDTDVALRQTGTTLADLKTEQKALQSAIENTPIAQQSGRLSELQKRLADNKAEIQLFKQAIEGTTTAQKQNTVTTQKQKTKLSELRAQLSQYKNELAGVNDQARQMGGANAELSARQAELSQSISQTNSQIQEASQGYRDQETVLNDVALTYNELKEQNRALTIAMRDIPIDDQTGQLERLREQYLENNIKLKEFDASMGNFQRNVGDYTGGIRTFASSLAVVQGPLGPIAGRLNSFATVIDKLSKTTFIANTSQSIFGKLLLSNIPLIKTSATATKTQAVATTIANTALKGLNTTLKLVRLSFAALGIGAIIAGLAGIVQFFTKTERGAQQLRVIMAGLSASFNVIRDRAIAFGETIVKALKDPKQAIIDLGKVILDNLINRFTAIPKIIQGAFGVISKGAMATGLAVKGIWSKEAREQSRELFKEAGKDAVQYANGLGQLFTGIEDPITKLVEGSSNLIDEISEASNVAKQLETQMNAVLVRERELSLQRALQNKELQKTREFARDLEQPAEQRLQALKDIAKAEQELLEQELDNERERLRIIIAKNKQSEDAEKDVQAVIDQQIKLADLERASSEKQMSSLRDINTVERQIREERLRRERIQSDLFVSNREFEFNVIKDNLIKEGKLAEALNLDLQRFKESEIEERERLENLYKAEFISLKFSEAEAEKLAKLKADQELKEELYKRQEAFDEQTKKDLIDSNKFDRDIALRRKDMLLDFERQRLIDQGRFAEAARLEELDKDVLKEELRLQFLQDFLDSGMEAGEAARRAEEEAELESAQRIFDAKKRLQDAELEQRLNIAKQISVGLGAINTAFFNDSKEIAVAKAIIDTLAGANAAFAETKGSIFLKSLAAASALSMGYANVRKILSTKIGDKSVSQASPSAPNISTSFGLVDVGTNSPIASQMASQVGAQSNQLPPTFVFTGDLDPEFMSIKVTQGSNSISSRTLGVGI
jgi:hypothetical protein